MNISLLLPTRARPFLIRRLFDSLLETTSDLRNLEVVLYLDSDDPGSHSISDSSLDLVKLIGPPRQTMGSMNSACFEASHGQYIMLINDDLVFRTIGWDRRVIESFHQFRDDIALVYGNDMDQGRTVPTFPIVSRAVYDVIGELCPEGYRSLHIESHLFDIFRQLRRLGHGRIVYLGDIVFEHMHFVVGKGSFDDTYIKKDQRSDDLLFIELDDERVFKAKRLAEHIEAVIYNCSTETAEGEQTRRAKSNRKGALMALLKRLLSPS